MRKKEKALREMDAIMNHKPLKARVFQRWQLYLLLLVPVAFVLVFNYGPMAGLVIAFKNYNVRQGIFGSTWVGLDNFKEFFTSFRFPSIMKNTLVLSLYNLVVTFPIPIIFALLLNLRKSMNMVGLIFQILNNRSGLYGSFYQLINGTIGPNILAEGPLFKHIYVWSGVWQGTGYSAIIYIAALSNVDETLHEAAVIDGASRWQRVLHIDIPTILPTASIMLILAVGNIMNMGFEKVLLMQNNLNLDYSEIISTYVYKVGLASGINDFSLSTAISLFNSVVNFLLLILANFTSKRLSGNGIF